MTRRLGFTLAEVLITLGIIGVVAAMTMPTLMNSTNGIERRTAYKKALSVLSQAIVLNVALDDYDLADTSVTDTTGTSVFNLFNTRMNVINTTVSTPWGPTEGEGETQTNMFGNASNYTLFFNDGIVFSFRKTAAQCTDGNDSIGHTDRSDTGTTTAKGKCWGVIDINGSKSPNKEVACDTGTSGNTCKVSNPTDIYPVIMYDQTILPRTEAAKAVLYGGK